MTGPAARRTPWWAQLITDVPDFPEPGVVFKDLTPLLASPGGFAAVVTDLVSAVGARIGDLDRIDVVMGMEARGFIVGPPVALALGAGFVPVRKQGKLPRAVREREYALEYGTATLAVHADALAPGSRVLLVDDVLATGGTVAATAGLVGDLGAEVIGVAVVCELGFLGGRERLRQAGLPAAVADPIALVELPAADAAAAETPAQ